MTATADLLREHPARATFDLEELAPCIDTCLDALTASSVCANACLGLDDIDSMRACIQNDMDVADICATTAKVLLRPGPHGHAWRAVVEACREVCDQSSAECSRHDHAHCRHCATATKACADACRALLRAAAT